MDHNPLKLQPGDLVTLDKGYGNSSEVIIADLSPKQSLATVYQVNDPGKLKWTVLTCRLSRITDKDTEAH